MRKWDRPSPPHDWRWYVGGLGKVLISVGLLMFGFVAYQLWGTAIENAAAQRALEDDFEEQLAEAPPIDFEAIATTPQVPAVEASGGDPSGGDPSGSDTDPPADDGETTDTDTAEDAAADAAAADTDTAEDAAADAATAEAVVVADVIPVDAQNIPEVDDGDAIARIEIPRIGLNDIVVAGVDAGDLKKGPGHFADTPLPGQLGNSAIAGHRTTYGQPFHDVDDLEAGDEIRVTTLTGIYTYRVTGQQIVGPSQYEVVATTDPTVASLTLISCHPKYTAKNRIIITSVLDDAASAPVGEPVLNYGRPEEQVTATDVVEDLPAEPDAPATADGDASTSSEATGTGDGEVRRTTNGTVTGSMVGSEEADFDQLGTAETNAGIADAFDEGWFSDPGAYPHIALWGFLLAAISIGAYLLSRRLRRDWAGALAGLVPFVVMLYFFFQNVNRLLPPNL